MFILFLINHFKCDILKMMEPNLSNLRGRCYVVYITEKKNGNESYYICDFSIDSKEYTQVIYIKAAIIEKDNTQYYLLYSSKMEVDSSAFKYLNSSLLGRSNNTKIKALEALKFLKAFEEISEKSLVDFKQADVQTLKYFLHGFSPAGQEYNFDLITFRSNDTVNGYLSVYRGYLEYLGITDHYLFKVSGLHNYAVPYDEQTAKKAKLRSNERSPQKYVEVPKYISVEEFIRIIEYVRKNMTIREEIILRLMYQCGLRIGEVLGLTADDIVMEKVDNGDYAPLAYIRNRVSDENWQQAKTCMKVVDKHQYFSEDYNTLNYGYQYVPLPQDLFDLINEYIEETHVEARNTDSKSKRYFAKTIADRVREEEQYEEKNYYIFINSIGTPLSIDTWNGVLREIYAATKIHVDKNKRKNNLNHRFRHGFAMFNVLYCGVNEAQLAKLLRHSNINSVMCYYQPTISDQIKLKTAFANSLYEVIPELRRKT